METVYSIGLESESYGLYKNLMQPEHYGSILSQLNYKLFSSRCIEVEFEYI